jgi:hypothetical protein
MAEQQDQTGTAVADATDPSSAAADQDEELDALLTSKNDAYFVFTV